MSAAERLALMSELSQLVSEGRNPSSMGIDLMSTAQILDTMNDADQTVAGAVASVIPGLVGEAQVRQTLERMAADIPDRLWSELEREPESIR